MDYFDSFNQRNEFRLSALEVIFPEGDDEMVAEELPFMSLDYDKGEPNKLTISFGEDTLVSSHTIENPVAMWESIFEGQVTTVKIKDTSDVEYKLIFI